MSGIAVLPPSPSLAGFGPGTHSGASRPIDPSLDSPTMYNSISSLASVLEIKEHAKSIATRSKGFSAKALISSARFQIDLARLRDVARDTKAALHAFYVAASLLTTYMSHPSYAVDRTKGNPIHNEFLQFFQENRDSLNRIKTLEAELHLERSTTTVSSHQGELSSITSLADRMKMLGQNGLVNPKTKRYSRKVPPAAHLQFTSFNSKNPPSSAQSPSSSPIPPGHSAGDVNEQGNVAFKAKQYTEAIQLYTKAIDINPMKPSYLINRAASYMALKCFRPALSDCQQAATLQSSEPSPKTFIRLARCQLALGLSKPALSTLRSVLNLEPTNTGAAQLKGKVLELETHLRNFESSRTRKEWGMACLALDKCLQSIRAEGGEIPTQWRLWRVELELSRGSMDAAKIAANDTLLLEPNSPEVLALCGLVFFLSGELSQALQHVASALRLDPGHEPAYRLRKRVKDVERLKEEGNTAFKGSRLQDAIARYTEALDRIGEIEEEGKGGQIRATILSNRATTFVKLNKYEEALLDTEASLVLYPTSFKALRTRARINLHFENFDAAIADFRTSMEQAKIEGADADVRALMNELKKAQAALKRSKTKDYYNILGVAKDCTEVEIKKAYKRESLKHHPDKGGDEEKFKLVVEAHAVLSDPQRRERYDMG